MEKLDLMDIENVLYHGNKEKIKRILKDYEVSYEYDFKTKSFRFKSKKLGELSVGYISTKVPNCVQYFGEKYEVLR